ncbi:diaminopimelate decarboxylase family protein [Nocardia sp. NPDC052566]|uniref:diaminopimelate decarboxylase family protein n=1 Tax=Nocardia sp. NPDC052566 TaxID=3364330 RepID=UPI0037CA72AE
MTLLDFFSAPRSQAAERLDSVVWPRDAHYDDDGRLLLGGVALTELADRFGTPVRVLDEPEIRARCRAYRKTFHEAEIGYCESALPLGAVAGWVAEEGLSVAVGTPDELSAALVAGIDPARIIMHGNGSAAAVEAAVAHGVGRITLSSFTEITLLATIATRRQRVLLHLAPQIDVHGHQDESLGFTLGAEATAAVERVLSLPGLELIGFHCALGAQIYNPDHYGEAIRRMVTVMAEVRADHDVILTDLDLGGGHAIAYRAGDAEMNLTELAAIVEDALDAACARWRFPRPNVALEPGRGIVARAGVTLYRVLSVKHHDGGFASVVVDSGSRCGTTDYRSGLVVANRLTTGSALTATIAGRAGDDILATGVHLPADLHVGDLLAAPCTGAYQRDMVRTPVVAVRDGRFQQLVARDPGLLDRDAS